MQMLRVVFQPFNDSPLKLVIVAGLCRLTVKGLNITHADDDVLHLLKALQVTSAKARIR